MKLLSVGIMTVALVFLSACSDNSSSADNWTYKPPRITEKIISTRPAIVRDVAFVNDESGNALTAIRLTEKDGPSMVKYSFYGYHPEIAIGTKVELTYLYQETKGQTTTHSTYLTRVCIKTPGEQETCADN